MNRKKRIEELKDILHKKELENTELKALVDLEQEIAKSELKRYQAEYGEDLKLFYDSLDPNNDMDMLMKAYVDNLKKGVVLMTF